MLPLRWFLRPCFALSALAIASASETPERARVGHFDQVLRTHLERYPHAELQDCYKLLFQACLGAEHAAPDEPSALARLEEEVAALGDGPDEPLIEPIDPDGSIVRVHLRPFVARGGDTRALARAFVATAGRTFGTRKDLAWAWTQLVTMAETRRLPFAVHAAKAFGLRLAGEGFPTVRHSAVFREEYRPAYRVVARDLLEGVLPPTPGDGAGARAQ